MIFFEIQNGYNICIFLDGKFHIVSDDGLYCTEAYEELEEVYKAINEKRVNWTYKKENNNNWTTFSKIENV